MHPYICLCMSAYVHLSSSSSYPITLCEARGHKSMPSSLVHHDVWCKFPVHATVFQITDHHKPYCLPGPPSGMLAIHGLPSYAVACWSASWHLKNMANEPDLTFSQCHEVVIHLLDRALFHLRHDLTSEYQGSCGDISGQTHQVLCTKLAILFHISLV